MTMTATREALTRWGQSARTRIHLAATGGDWDVDTPNAQPASTRAVTVTEATRLLGLTPLEILQMIRSEKLPALKLNTGPYLIAVRDVLALAAI